MTNGIIEGNSIYENVLVGLSFEEANIIIPSITANEGYVSLGWDKNIPDKIESDLVFIALYESKPIEAPETGDDIYSWVIVLIVNLVILSGLIILLKKRSRK